MWLSKTLTAMLALTIALSASVQAKGTGEAVPLRSSKPIVAVSILPQQYFVREIGADSVDTLVLVGEGQSPHSYEPTPRQMTALSQADVWILSGTDFEIGLTGKITSLYPRLKVVDATEGMKLRLLEEEQSAHEEEDHGHGAYDKHTWLGRDNAKVLATHVRDALMALNPDQAGVYQERYVKLLASIDSVYSSLAQQLAPLQGRAVFVYHPSFGYLFDDLGIVQKAVETGGKEPTPKILSALMKDAIEQRAAAIFVQKQFPSAAASTIATSIGATVVALDPLAPDWLDNIQRIGQALQQVMEEHR